jgi:flagellar protein FlaG
MNVTPVTAPGPTSSSQIEVRTRGPQTAAPAPDRGHVLQRAPASAGRAAGQAASQAVDGKTAAILDRANEIDDADLQKAEQLRAFVASEKFDLRTYHDENSGRQIIEVRDQTTGDVVSQYPSEELVRLYTSLRQSLIDQRA